MCIYRRYKVKLSSLLGQIPSLFDNRKIQVVDKGLTDIDHLPRHFHHVKVHLDTLSFHVCTQTCDPLPFSVFAATHAAAYEQTGACFPPETQPCEVEATLPMHWQSHCKCQYILQLTFPYLDHLALYNTLQHVMLEPSAT